MILKYIARAAAPDTPPLYGKKALESCTIDQWMDYCNTQFMSGPGLQAAVASAGKSPSCLMVLGLMFHMCLDNQQAWLH